MKHLPHNCPFMRGVHQSPVDSLHKWPVMERFNASFFANMNKLLHKESSCWWFEMPWRSSESRHKLKASISQHMVHHHDDVTWPKNIWDILSEICTSMAWVHGATWLIICNQQNYFHLYNGQPATNEVWYSKISSMAEFDLYFQDFTIVIPQSSSIKSPSILLIFISVLK